MKTVIFFIIFVLSLICLITPNVDARYYTSIKYNYTTRFGDSCVTIRLGMTFYEVKRICGSPVRKCREYLLDETQGHPWPKGFPSRGKKRGDNIVYNHCLYNAKNWTRAKIFRFRGIYLYEIYDAGTKNPRHF